MRKSSRPTAFVTGASNGIGRATAIAFAREGCNLMLFDCDSKGEETAAEIKKMGAQAVFQKGDVSNEENVRHAIARSDTEFGRLDYAFNNAGVEGESGPLADCSLENWERVLDINLKGIFLCIKYQIPQLLKNGGGSIVNCSSIAGLIGFPESGPYTASKHGIIGLTKSAALELATSKIRVNAVCPGVIATPMIDRATHHDAEALKQLIAPQPIGRMGTPEEIAHAVTWLCSDKASLVTGVSLPVDGGWTAH